MIVQHEAQHPDGARAQQARAQGATQPVQPSPGVSESARAVATSASSPPQTAREAPAAAEKQHMNGSSPVVVEPVAVPVTLQQLVCRLCERLIPAADILQHTSTCLETFPVRCACVTEDAALSTLLHDAHVCASPACAAASQAATEAIQATSSSRVAAAAAAACAAQLNAVEGALADVRVTIPSACNQRVRAIRKLLKKKVKMLHALAGAPRDVMSAAAGKVFSLSTLEFLKPISEGGAGQVYLARQRTTGDIFAVKIMSKHDLRNKNMVERVKNERRIMSATSEDKSNQCTVKLYASFRTREHVVLVMEYVPGGDVYSLLRGVGRLDVETTRIFAAQLVLALEYLHGLGIAHRDLKPDNILITLRGSLKLTDFGLSHAGVTRHAVTSASRFGSNWWSRDKSSSSALAASLDMDGVSEGPDDEVAARDVELAEVDVDTELDAATLPGETTVVTDDGGEVLVQTTDAAPSNGSRSSSGAVSYNASANAPATGVPGAIMSAATGSDSSSATNGDAPLRPATASSNHRAGGAVPPPSRALLDSSTASYMSVASDTQRRKLYSPVGTSNYLSPEVTLSIGHDERVDWWSLGVVIFEFLTGYPPFMDPHGNVDAVYENILDRRIQWSSRVAIPADAKDIIEKLLTLRPNQRLGSRGAKDVKAHPFFAGVDWSTVMTATTRFVPAPIARDDTSYFEVPQHLPQQPAMLATHAGHEQRAAARAAAAARAVTSAADSTDTAVSTPEGGDGAAQSGFSDVTYVNLRALAQRNVEEAQVVQLKSAARGALDAAAGAFAVSAAQQAVGGGTNGLVAPEQ